jgi:hypothetical protein
MNINYRLEIVGLEVLTNSGSLENVVYNVYGRYWADGDGVTQTRPISVPLPAPTEDWIPYSQLTEEDVIGWVNDRIDIQSIQLELSQSIHDLNSPKESVILPKPW